ncbi:MAG: hypothetical protein ACYTGN_10460 [Planctomycetota bacterium]|jgi:type II secretory pathway pseudopilin PulG
MNNSRGFGLLELMFAAFALAIAAVGLAAALAQGTRLTDGVQEEMLARNAIRGKFAEVSSTEFAAVAATYHGSGFDIEGLRAPADDPDGKPGEVSFTYGPGGDQSFYIVRIRVHWIGRSGNRDIEVLRYLANVRGDTGAPPVLE